MLFLFLISLLSSCVTPEKGPAAGGGAVIVDQAGRGDFPTIQEAVDSATMGQVIRIRGGTYAEAVKVATGGLTLEAFDPVNEPVYLDGADQAFLDAKPVWEPAGGGVFKAAYEWPFTPPSDAEYSNPDSGTYVFQVYEDETLLRGYRNPFDRRFQKNRMPVRFPDGRYGLAGAYASPGEIAAGPGEKGGRDSKPDPERAGRCYYDRANAALVLAPAAGEPGAHRYAVPVIPSLLTIRASGTIVRDLVFTHSLDYAVSLDAADGTVINGCYFRNCHFAVRAGRTSDLAVRNCVIIENGFRERYSGEDAAGTLYERPTIALDPAAPDQKILLENNVIKGAPFTLAPGRGAVTVRDNAVSDSIFGLFAPRYLASTADNDFDSRLEITGNVFHHLDGGIVFPSRPDRRLELFLYRNCIYLAASSGFARADAGEPGPHCAIYNNVLAFAGSDLQRPLDGWLGGNQAAFNNLFYAENVEYAIFAATGSGNPYPVVGGSVLGDSLYLTPQAEAAGVGEVRLRNALFLYARVRGASAVPPVGAAKKAPCFAQGRPLTDKAFFDGQFDPLVLVGTGPVYRDGAASFCKAFRERLFAAFLLDAKSPARGRGRPIDDALPGGAGSVDRNPDIGARDF
jgi:hypothetical protein